ncbi:MULTISPECIES: hypothetical protein [unclassified Sulfuricurvum]|uniref:hypothetical protein n=1 Tax=unclassified Sulfuricurvum TaxID=2632390 RepID=UPI0002997B55|nr:MULTISPECIES: hypothetical protein [unclassified Sulfuricurvum]AFV98420.1 hypothetical protein B649_10545 [Candidatus Sulfuricurvum sp. RIFRC-1]HBM36614.1 hypothetical protein [Sulfuricurvum sp.]
MESLLSTTLLTIAVTLLTLFAKSHFELKKAKYQAKITHLSDSLKAILEAISAIQSMKDSLQIILEAFEDAMSKEHVIEKINLSTERLVKAYEEYGGYLSQDEIQPFHKAKNLSLRSQPVLTNMLKNVDYPSELQKADKESIKIIRDELTDFQNRLRDYRDVRRN